jgi:hypothetical protein
VLSYNQRLKEQIRRREAARTRVKLESRLLADTFSAKVEDTRASLMDKIDEAKAAVNHRIDFTREKVAGKIDQARTAFVERYEETKHTLSPQTHIRQHPWGWLAGFLAAGFVAAPAVRTYFTGRRSPPPAAPQAPSAAASSERTIGPEKQGFRSALLASPLVAALTPHLTDFAKRFLERGLDRVLPPQGSEPTYAEPAQAGSAGKFAKSISRRTAPPPRES